MMPKDKDKKKVRSGKGNQLCHESQPLLLFKEGILLTRTEVQTRQEVSPAHTLKRWEEMLHKQWASQ